MKKLLTLLSTVSIASSSPLTAMYVFGGNSSTTNIDSDAAVKASQTVASSLIAKKDNHLNSQDFLNYSLDKDPNKNNNIYEKGKPLSIATGLNRTFGQHANLSMMVDSKSNIKDTDSTDKGQELAPSNILAIQKILDALKDAKDTTDPSMMMLLGYGMNLPKIIGPILAKVVGSTNPIVKMIQQMPLNVIEESINGFNTTIKNCKTYGSFDKTTGAPDDTSAFSVFLVNVVSAYYPYSTDPSPKNLDALYSAIGQFAILLVNYISQFNVTKTGTISDNMYSTTDTNETVRTKIDTSKPVDTNFDNLGNLIYNLAHFDDNDGLGFAQLTDILFGAESSIGLSTDNNKANILAFQLVPEKKYLNPLMFDLSWITNMIITAKPEMLPDFIKNNPLLLKILQNSDINLAGQMFSLIGGLLDNIATNQKIDNQINLIDGAVLNFKTLAKNLNITLPDNINDILNNVEQFDSSIRSNTDFMSLNDDFTPTTGDLEYNITPIKESGKTWDDLYNGNNLTFYKNFADAINLMLSSTGSTFKLPEQFNGIKSLLDNLTNKVIPGTTLTIHEIITSLDDKNGFIDFLSKNLGPMSKMLKGIVDSIENQDLTKNAKDWVDQNIDTSKDKTGKIKTILSQKGGCNLADYLTIISIATYQNAFKNACTSDIANAEWFNLIGYDPKTGSETTITKGATIYKVLEANKDLYQGLITSLATSMDDLVNNLEGSFYTTLQDSSKDSTADEKVTNNNITYKLTDYKTKKVYDVELYYNSSTNFYTLGISQEATK